MTDPTFTARKVARAAEIPEARLRLWRQRGYLDSLEISGGNGWTRCTLGQVMQIATFADLIRFGLSPSGAAKHVQFLHAYKDDQALLLVWHGPMRTIPPSERGGPVPGPTEGPWAYGESNPDFFTSSTIIPAKKLSEYIEAAVLNTTEEQPHRDVGPLTRGLLIININKIESRVRKKLGLSDSEDE